MWGREKEGRFIQDSTPPPCTRAESPGEIWHSGQILRSVAAPGSYDLGVTWLARRTLDCLKDVVQEAMLMLRRVACAGSGSWQDAGCRAPWC